jgi:glyoxylase-like metal-dependent hydrolase (beta-lactamase superfamily II)
MKLRENLYLHRDTTNVYVLVSGREATCIDIGDGSVLDHLDEFGVDSVTDVVMTHHHRDGAQGLHRGVAAGARVWVPAVERDLFDGVDQHWQMRHVEAMYDLREDRFSLLESVPVAGNVAEYRAQRYGGVELTALPTPGHTPGSMSYVLNADGTRVIFCGDLLRDDGKVHSLAAMQWSYNGLDGNVDTILSALDLLDWSPDLLLPAHGEPVMEPRRSIELVTSRLQWLIDLRDPKFQIAEMRSAPFKEVTPHLLWNTTSLCNTYVLLSEQDGAALFIDYGYDFWPYLLGFWYPYIGPDRASRTPWLHTLPALKRDYGVARIEVALPTHYHDDHVATFNLLRDVEGAEVWAAETFAPILREPSRYDLPCLWFDPIPVDRELRLETPFQWREYELTLHELPGHTLYAVAIEFEVDGKRILATGDQQDGGLTQGRIEFTGYDYRNRFRIDDYVKSAELYRRVAPDDIVTGHWPPTPVTHDYLDGVLDVGRRLAAVHRELLPLDDVDHDAEGFGTRIEPYRPTVNAGIPVALDVRVRNPLGKQHDVTVELVAPDGWAVEPSRASSPVDSKQEATLRFDVTPPAGLEVRRARVAADVTVGERRFGQQAEALITVQATER